MLFLATLAGALAAVKVCLLYQGTAQARRRRLWGYNHRKRAVEALALYHQRNRKRYG